MFPYYRGAFALTGLSLIKFFCKEFIMKIVLQPAMKVVKRSPEELFLGALFYGDYIQDVPIIYHFDFPDKKVYAEGINVAGGFMVLKDSLAANSENRKLNSHHKKLRKELVDSGTLMDRGLGLEFTRPYLFHNEYEATGVIAGNNRCRNHSGVWYDGKGRTPLENRLADIIELEAKCIQQINS
jgi:hypothetical protein